MKKSQAELCAQNMGDALKYMGTTTVAKDIDFMATSISGPDALMYVLPLISREPPSPTSH